MTAPTLSERDARFPDLRNLRDVGGLRTHDGRRVRHGVLYRSATPMLVDASQARMLRELLRIRTRADLRSAREIEETPNPHLEGSPRVEHLPVRAGGRWQRALDVADPSSSVAAHYLRYLEHSGGSVAALTRLAADPSRTPALVHCTAGKDRTGVSLAILLSAVGVVREDVVADYARTRADLDALLVQLRGLPSYEQRLAALPEESLTAEPRSMELFLDRVDEVYGGPRAYLARHGVGDDTLAEAERALLEP